MLKLLLSKTIKASQSMKDKTIQFPVQLYLFRSIFSIYLHRLHRIIEIHLKIKHFQHSTTVYKWIITSYCQKRAKFLLGLVMSWRDVFRLLPDCFRMSLTSESGFNASRGDWRQGVEWDGFSRGWSNKTNMFSNKVSPHTFRTNRHISNFSLFHAFVTSLGLW